MRIKRQIAAGVAGQIERQREVMGRLNGENAKQLADKYKFTEIVRQMGYTAPSQVLVTADQSPEHIQVQLRDTAQLFPDNNQPVICKPYDGHGGIQTESSIAIETAFARSGACLK